MRPLRVTPKRIIVNVSALEDFLAECNIALVDAIETVWEHCHELRDQAGESTPAGELPDEDDPIECALIDVEMVIETLHELFSPRAQAPDGPGFAPQVIIGKNAESLTIVRGSSPADVAYTEARDNEKDAEWLAAALASGPTHKPRLPLDDDLEPVFVELLEERYASILIRQKRPRVRALPLGPTIGARGPALHLTA